MTAAGMTCDFVGHPVVAEPVAGRVEAAAFRAARGIAGDAPLVAALPGSRRSEIARLLPPFGETLHRWPPCARACGWSFPRPPTCWTR